MICQTFDNTYPNYKNLIPNEDSLYKFSYFKISKQQLLDNIKTAKDDDAITINIKDNNVYFGIATYIKDDREYAYILQDNTFKKISNQCTFNPDAPELFAVLPKRLKELTKVDDTDELTIYFKNQIMYVSNGKDTYLIALISNIKNNVKLQRKCK
mgnify:CR=1 FL=1